MLFLDYQSGCNPGWKLLEKTSSPRGRLNKEIITVGECLNSCIYDINCVAIDIKTVSGKLPELNVNRDFSSSWYNIVTTTPATFSTLIVSAFPPVVPGDYTTENVEKTNYDDVSFVTTESTMIGSSSLTNELSSSSRNDNELQITKNYNELQSSATSDGLVSTSSSYNELQETYEHQNSNTLEMQQLRMKRASKDRIECRLHHSQHDLLETISDNTSIQYQIIRRCGNQAGCEPLWSENYNKKDINGKRKSDVHDLIHCKIACIDDVFCHSLQVYVNPRKGPNECWLNYKHHSYLVHSYRFLHLTLIDRCGASTANLSHDKSLKLKTSDSYSLPYVYNILDYIGIIIAWACITTVALISITVVYIYKRR